MDPLNALIATPPDLPVAEQLDRVVDELQNRGAIVIQAPPGTGKTTLVPPAVAMGRSGRVVVTQPRRIAARAAARHLAHLLGEPLGMTVGHTVRGESTTTNSTRVEFVTTGILLRRLQANPELPGVSAVIIDEVHERQLDGDLALALLRDVHENLRDDLDLVAMSATVEAERTAAALGEETAVIEIEGALYPVETVWVPSRVQALDVRGVPREFCSHVGAVTRQALAENSGDILVFVPGVREVDLVVQSLRGVDADVRPLHGRLPSRDQDVALSQGIRRRVVVSTAVAESSLTVPGVRVVVDAGLSREPRTDHRRGLAGLVTVSASRASADQRAGRAGRQGPGVVYRCWTAGEHAMRREHPEPQIRTADLTGLALELAVWGAPGGGGLRLLDPMPPAAYAAALGNLVGLGLVNADGTVTARGRTVASLPVDPRHGRALVDGAAAVGVHRAAQVVAALSDDFRVAGGDLPAALRTLRRGGPQAAAWDKQTRRLKSAAAKIPGTSRTFTRSPAPSSDDLAVGIVSALAYPDRVARRRPGSDAYLMASGTGAVLPPGSPLLGTAWLAIADVDRAPGRSDAMIRAAAPIDEETAVEAAEGLWVDEDEVEWSRGRVEGRRVTRLGAIELSSTPLRHPAPDLVRRAIQNGLRREGLGVLRWTAGSTDLRRRMDFLHRELGSPWPDVSDEALVADLATWLGPDLARVGGALSKIDVGAALRRLFPWPAATHFNELAPERVAVPSGSMIRLDYSGEQPVLAVRLQETFGWQETPRIADGRVPLLIHLLSPAGRPAAVTADLGSFWATGYPQVRAELRGRYPKHSWPEDPADGVASRKVRRPREGL